MSPERPDLEEERARRWWQRRPPVRSLERAAAFIDDVGFALLFGMPDGSMPSLHGVARDRRGRDGDGLPEGWGPDAERVWVWKDELPKRGLAWYGRFVRGRSSMLSLDLLRDLYPRSGTAADFREAHLDPDALRISEIILLNGPTSSAILREETGAFGPKGRSRFDRALSMLGRGLVLTHAGVEEQGAGWPAAILELTARAFDVGGSAAGASPEVRAEARLRVARRFLDTMVQARPYELGNAFGWGGDGARQAFEQLLERGEARRVGPAFRLTERNRSVGHGPFER